VSINGVISFFSYFLLLATLLPISLVISLEISKVVQSIWIIWDARMFAIERDRPAKVASTNIIEELGQINYIFSDKTGTLTRNIMEFKFMYIGAKLYGNAAELGPKTEQPALVRKVTHTDNKTGVELTFMDEELN
jgi:phospholipid-translocating ATPase